jgi:hypothetical protein
LSIVGAKYIAYFEEDAKKRMLAGKSDPEAMLSQGDRGPQARDEAAELVNVSARSISKGKKVLEEALELADSVRADRRRRHRSCNIAGAER